MAKKKSKLVCLIAPDGQVWKQDMVWALSWVGQGCAYCSKAYFKFVTDPKAELVVQDRLHVFSIDRRAYQKAVYFITMGRHIAAIKDIRSVSSTGLREAKEYADVIRAQVQTRDFDGTAWKGGDRWNTREPYGTRSWPETGRSEYFWNCKCQMNFVHPHGHTVCAKCGTLKVPSLETTNVVLESYLVQLHGGYADHLFGSSS